jgi:hypothetical protein
MATKEIKTRIALRTGDYAYWTTGAGKDIELYKGEVCICTIAQADNQATNAPTVLFKVANANGQKFADLNWVSGLAADVYEWAKKNEVKVVGEGNAVTDAYIKDGYLELNKGETFATKGELEELRGGLEADTNTTYQFSIPTEGDDKGKLLVEKKEVGETTWTKVNAYDFVTPDELTAILGDYYTKGEVDGLIQGVEAKLPTSADYGVLEVKGDDASGVIVDKTDTQRPIVKIAANTYDAHGAAAGVQSNLTAYENAHASDYTNTKIDELVQGAKDYADNNDANTEYHVEYDSTNKKIKLVAGADANKMEIDATAFIKDGMIESVELVTEDDGGRVVEL